MNVSDQDEAMFQALRRHHLRHPGAIAATVVRLIYARTVSADQIGKARAEYLRLGLHQTPATRSNA